MSGPLTGIKVVDMSRYIAGPYCCMMLGDMGADVIKIERRGRGEDSRVLMPFKDNRGNRVSLYFTQYNKNKRSLAIDLYKKEGMDVLKDIISKADVMVENFRPGTLDKMGLTKDVLKKINPKLIVTSISGFGQEGLLRDRAAFDCIGQAMGGVMSVTGPYKGEPMMAGTWVADFTTALYAAFGTVSALMHQQKSGQGQFLDISIVECVSSILATAIPNYCANGIIQPLRGNRDNVCAPADLYKVKDGYVYVHAGTQPLFERWCEIADKKELLEDSRFLTAELRMKHFDEIGDILQDWCKDMTAQELEDIMSVAGIPVGKCRNVADLVEDPDMKARESICYIDYPGVGEIALPGVTVKMSETPGAIRYRPPMVGEHNVEILKEYCNMTDEQIEGLRQREII